MTQEILERLAASLVFITAFAVLIKGLVHVRRRSVRKKRLPVEHHAGAPGAGPTLYYFWSAGCSLCTPQEMQLDRAEASLLKDGRTITVRKVNALEDEQLVKMMRVMTVPTTVLVNARGTIAAWNPGFTPWRTIVDQYQAIV